MRRLTWILILLTFGSPIYVQAQKKPEKPAPSAAGKPGLGDFDDFVNQALKDWKVPGVAVGVVQDGKGTI